MNTKNNPPQKSDLELAAAAQLALLARRRRAEVKEKLGSGELAVRELLDTSDQALLRMKISELLESLPGIGKIRAELILEKCGISQGRRIAGLGKNQRRKLLETIDPQQNSKILSNLSGMSGAALYGKLFVISGPGGVGKSTITKSLSLRPEFAVSVSVTTRPPRNGEVDGREYYFVDRDEFSRRVAENEFLEWAEFADNFYGTLEKHVHDLRITGKHVVLEIELQGARQVRESHPEAISIFIAPPSWEELEARIRGRGSDDEDRIARRLSLAQEELAASSEFDHVLINSDVDSVVAALVSLTL
jgi:guanylate kinase